MSFIGCDGRSCDGAGAHGIRADEKFSVRNALRLFAVALAAATLAACTQHSVVTDRSASLADSSEASPAPARRASPLIYRRVAAIKKKHARSATRKPAAGKQGADGLASFYGNGSGHGPRTANGEKFDPGELTAAHRTLPFGTRVRVTDVATGRSVTVRINDRGPFVGGRVVDVSTSAAETLGIVGRGVAKVKLDVVQ